MEFDFRFPSVSLHTNYILTSSSGNFILWWFFFRYKLIVTKTKIKMANAAIWIFSICILLATMKYVDENECIDPYVCTVASELAYGRFLNKCSTGVYVNWV